MNRRCIKLSQRRETQKSLSFHLQDILNSDRKQIYGCEGGVGEGCDHRGPAEGDFGGNGNHLHFDSGGDYCMRVTKLIEQ